MSAFKLKESVLFELCCVFLSIAQLGQLIIIAIAVQAHHCIRNTGRDLGIIRAPQEDGTPDTMNVFLG